LASSTSVAPLHESWAWEDDLAFVAELEGQLVGQVLYTHAIVDAEAGLVDVLVLSPIGVRPDLQNQEIGSHLIRHTLAGISQRPEPLVFLEGHPGFYPRFGFSAKLAKRLAAPYSGDAFMALELLPGTMEDVAGEVNYPPPFQNE
jgi:putative acetyltransferase